MPLKQRYTLIAGIHYVVMWHLQQVLIAVKVVSTNSGITKILSMI